MPKDIGRARILLGGQMEMEPCLLCDVNSVPLASGEAPICGSHWQQAHAAFEAAEPILRTHLEQAYGAELDEWVRQGVLPGLTWHWRCVTTLRRRRVPCRGRSPAAWCTSQMIGMVWCGLCANAS